MGRPFRKVPFRKVPFRKVPFHKIPFRKIPFRKVPFRKIPNRFVSFRFAKYRKPDLKDLRQAFSNTAEFTRTFLRQRLLPDRVRSSRLHKLIDCFGGVFSSVFFFSYSVHVFITLYMYCPLFKKL